MRTLLRRTLTSAALAVATAVPLVATVPAAQAAGYETWTQATVTYNSCQGVLTLRLGPGNTPQAQGTLLGNGFYCQGWLELRKGSGAYKTVSQIHYNYYWSNSSTDFYNDPIGYQARMCVQSVYGGSVGCTSAW